MSDSGQPLPKFGEWDVNDPSSAESFTVIFNKARDERKTGSDNQGTNSLPRELSDKQGTTAQAISKRSSGFFVEVSSAFCVGLYAEAFFHTAGSMKPSSGMPRDDCRNTLPQTVQNSL